jgi:hypothetical protein
MKAKRAVITFVLVEESDEVSNERIQKEILDNLSEISRVVPWSASIEKVNVINN